jgi:CMP-N,N'-diacetyllegionaminic acid synthase
MTTKKPIAIIPARVGSQRIKLKNVILFHNKPLIYWTIKSAIESKVFAKIYISTDGTIIKNELNKFKEFKNKIFFLYRPKKLSGSKTKTSSLIKYLIKKNSLEKFFTDFILLQPTSPLRRKEHIRKMWNIYKKYNLKDLFSISEKKNKFIINKNNRNIFSGEKKINSKKLKSVFQNGSIYIKNLQSFKKDPNFVTKNSSLYFMSKRISLDVDTLKDLEK